MLLRLLRPYSAYQQSVDSRMLDAIDDLERRLREQEELQLGRLTEDLFEALESLRSRVAGVEDVAAGARAVPYMSPGALEQFRDPTAGVVLGYRNGDPERAPIYLGFEQVFRGPEERVAERQQIYVDLLAGQEPVLDAGCGRGELLDLLGERGISCNGIDADAGMVAHCHAKGHAGVTHATASEYLARLEDAELGAVFSAQVIEHMPYDVLTEFLALSFAKLRSGGLFVAETPNPHAPHALKTFWVDPTHRHPLFPEAALVLCHLAGFASAYCFHPLGSGHVDDDRYRESEYTVVAKKA